MKKRERDIAADVSAAVDDLVRTIRRKEAEFTMAGKERVKGAGWATGSDTAAVLARVALAAEVDGYCEAKTPEAMTEDDLVQAMRAKVSDAQAIARPPLGASPIRRVKVGVAWAVRLSVTVGETLWADGCSHYSTNSRDDRALFSSRERAKDVLRHWSRVVSEVETSARPDAPRIVRVTFYEVQREKA